MDSKPGIDGSCWGILSAGTEFPAQPVQPGGHRRGLSKTGKTRRMRPVVTYLLYGQFPAASHQISVDSRMRFSDPTIGRSDGSCPKRTREASGPARPESDFGSLTSPPGRA
jgi:hypothetical protein